MDASTKRSVEIALAWCGPVFVVGYLIFWGIMGHNIPPPNMMGMTGQELVSEYYGKYPEIGVGMIACAVIGLIYLPWSLQLASMLRDKDGSMGVLSLMELAGGILTAWVLAFCPAIWAACSILVNTVDPNVIKFVHTFTWFIYDCTFMITTIQVFGLGLYTILNKEQKMFPAWAGWSALATGTVFFPLVFLPFVSEGPFMLPGLWNFFLVFGIWLFAFFSVYSFFMLKHLYGTKAAERASGGLGLRAS